MPSTLLHPQIFVGGAGCSGTTLAADLLGHHSWLSPVYETAFVIRGLRIAAGQPAEDLGDVARIRCLLDGWASHLPALPHSKAAHEHYVHGPHHVLFDAHDVASATRRYQLRREAGQPGLDAFADLVLHLFEAHCRRDRKRAWVNKTPAYVRHLDHLLQAFPRLKFIHCVRDPRAVTAAVLRRPFGPDDAAAVAHWWTGAVTAATRFSEENRVFHLRYEALIRDPGTTLGSLCEFLDIPPLSPGDVDRIVPRLDGSRLDAWISTLSSEQHATVECVTREVARGFGYAF